jgi:hypothetical protein
VAEESVPSVVPELALGYDHFDGLFLHEVCGLEFLVVAVFVLQCIVDFVFVLLVVVEADAALPVS